MTATGAVLSTVALSQVCANAQCRGEAKIRRADNGEIGKQRQDLQCNVSTLPRKHFTRSTERVRTTNCANISTDIGGERGKHSRYYCFGTPSPRHQCSQYSFAAQAPYLWRACAETDLPKQRVASARAVTQPPRPLSPLATLNAHARRSLVVGMNHY